MEAMILAAGEGTRLRPLTYKRPKPLIPVLNTPLLEITLSYLRGFSTSRIIINSHHLADQVAAFVALHQNEPRATFTMQFEPEILGTGGGLARTRDFWNGDDFLVINGDILTDIDLNRVRDFHVGHGGLATLVLHDYPAFNQIEVDGRGDIRRFRTGTGKGLAFTGIHFLKREIFDHLSPVGSYDIIDVYQKMIDQGQPVRAYLSQGHYWRDVGTPQSYLAVHGELLLREAVSSPAFSFQVPRGEGTEKGPDRHFPPGKSACFLIHPQAEIEEGVEWVDWAVVGRGSRLKRGCRLARSVLWENTVLEEGVFVSDSVVGDGVRVEGDFHDGVLV